MEQSHLAIIDPAVFEMVQREMERRSREGRRYSGVSIFSGKIKCGECGGWFGMERRGGCKIKMLFVLLSNLS